MYIDKKAGERTLCRSCAKKGSRNPFYGKYGNAHPKYTGSTIYSERLIARGRSEYKEWRTSVFKKDGYSCQICKYRGKGLEADHIKPWASYPEYRYDVNNGRTLCKKCHVKTDTYGYKSIKIKEGLGKVTV